MGLQTSYKSQGGKWGEFTYFDLLQPNDWLGKIDLKDAYFVVPIWEKHQKFLRFVWKDSLMEFACLPFGLALAPRVFTKLMKPGLPFCEDREYVS